MVILITAGREIDMPGEIGYRSVMMVLTAERADWSANWASEPTAPRVHTPLIPGDRRGVSLREWRGRVGGEGGLAARPARTGRRDAASALQVGQPRERQAGDIVHRGARGARIVAQRAGLSPQAGDDASAGAPCPAPDPLTFVDALTAPVGP
jgi:hypothetical protein